ncbi:NADPH dehydrogenase NamA [Hydrotalea sandarakina]|jgi:2,4-dienoyl-CoA reductase-like NADH-dependent reductase (Old Yellow Enzyme family)|uniref:2,4-dienoyl-CoA reductase-like NADH-dependent reductase (Old Yellow Enzyme family) n=1 Tax=Hydrotalea sandarakina TaxID=1004304 RepID=A0A2W7SRH2_9BACT|nr:NADPH dehydrogenase NamA [Hydrotalea sandarakina]PZX65625.1 2,4-dienoyl-CoA reductase-like NADH-dependent reductase (Old Yellow Enzyme family) [Hydrotalea sandarakina]
MSLLFQPITIKNVSFKNRIVVSPMCQYSANDGFANDWHLVHLGSRAVGGAGLVFTEAAAVSAEGRISPADIGIWKDEHIPMLQRIAAFIEQQGAVPGIQLAHAGRKASCRAPWEGGMQVPIAEGGWPVLAPSAIPFKETTLPVEALTILQIKEVLQQFKIAAKRALTAGFKVVEIHAAHGYLIHQFLSPISNHRTDEYGGSFENRIRFLLEVVQSVQEEWPSDLPLFVRISATDWHEQGWQLENSVALAHHLKRIGVDVIDCSSGGNIPHAQIPVAPGYQVPFASTIKKETGILTGAVGLITMAAQANEILEQQFADFIFMAREFLRNPYFPMHAAKVLNEEMPWPKQYERAK